MNKTLSQRLSTNRLRRACAVVPSWIVTGISGAEGDGGGDGGNGNNGGNGGTEPTARERALQEEKDRHFKKAEEAKTAAAESAAKLKEAEDKLAALELADKSDKEKAEAAATKAEEAKTAAEARVAELELAQRASDIKLAFLQNTKYTWHNPGTALKLLDLDGVEIKDSEVKGLDKAIDKLAKDEAYLVKVGPANDGKGGQNNGQQTGAAGNGGSTRQGNNQTSQQRENELQGKYNIPR
jgi:hypothetical protein